MPYTRALRYQFPLLRGEDVLELQFRLRDSGYVNVGQPDGVFGAHTEEAVLIFQKDRGLKPDGIVGPITWTTLFEESQSDTTNEKILAALNEIQQSHGYRDSVVWRLNPQGICINDEEPEDTGGEPQTVRHVWQAFSEPIEHWASMFGVPVELIIATICTETRGDPSAVREEPGYISDERTPNKVSPGLMQTLISTARTILGDGTINRAWLLEPGNSIRAGTAYIASQWKATNFDPPKVACAYNAGGIYYNPSPENRWKMRQYPINSAEHADRFIRWFNDCFRMFEKDQLSPDVSYFRQVRA